MRMKFELPWAWTYADMTPGRTDKEKREKIRDIAAKVMPADRPSGDSTWEFRICVRKAGRRPFDIENVPKLIIDAFCARQIERDGSPHTSLGLYPDDTIDHVQILHVEGERVQGPDESTRIEIIAHTRRGP